MAGGDRDPWKNRKTVRICSAIDMVFPIVIMGLYMYRLMFERKVDGRMTNGFYTPKEKQGVAVFLWCGAFTLNIIQFILAYNLSTVVKLGSRDADVSLRGLKFWLILANFLFVLLLSEFIFFLFFDKGYYGHRKTVSMIVCAAELFFKPIGMYFAKEFIDDLKSVYAPPTAKVQFMSFLSSVRKPQGQTGDV
ncbi:hypothetical protein Ocin01_12074 [Orchesella cincta]|uniref:Uncharacterized protein n=1 Tax=Orchesella cincta TaxID=48709 RepID=A0A1D2MNK1_ORCCI|nr:hypothetical protein Ocin01_12074 [Orchesella cincta]